jgi:uridine phosphorylase
MYLGRHTCLSWLRDEGKLGAVPPFVIAAGDRRRVARVLDRLDEAVDLAALARRMIGPSAEGRVALGVGQTAGTPVLAVDHPGGARAVIRVGTCGALGGGALAIAGFASGWSAAAEQSRRGVLGPPAEFDPARPPRPPHLPCSPEVIEALRDAAPDAVVGGVFSKDSLYAEQGEGFARLLRDLDCVATEMELATIGPVANQLGIAWGGIMASAGCLEGEAWFDTGAVEGNEQRAIEAALAAIRALAV